jgi:uncharacterized protein YbjT (DUF2867 family)
MILVTGAAGLSGSAIVSRCVTQGIVVRALVRNAKAASHIAGHGVDIVEGDMADPETLGRALAGVDRALMISSANGRMEETQCTFIDACKRFGVRHVVKFSGAEDGFDPEAFVFTAMHERIEDYLERSGLAWTHLRPSQFMQVYLREARTIVESDELRLPLGGIELAPVDIADVAAVAVEIVRTGGHDGHSYMMTGPEALTGNDIAGSIGAARDRAVRYVSITPERRRDDLLAAGAPAYFADGIRDQALERLKHPRAKIHLETHRRFGIIPTRFGDFAKRHATQFAGEPQPAPRHLINRPRV